MPRLIKLTVYTLGMLSIAFCDTVCAQVQFNMWSGNYIELKSYLGVETDERFNSFQFEINSSSIHHENWSLGVRLLGPVIPLSGNNVSGHSFPPDKISLRWTLDNENININLNAIGADRNYIFLQQANEVMLINRSASALETYGNNNYGFMLYGALRIESGGYLEEYVSENQYQYLQYGIPLQFTLYDEQGNTIGSRRLDYIMQVSPKLTDGHLVDIDPDFGLIVGAEASDVTLNFNNQNDYIQGVSKLIQQAVSVYSKSDFELRVKALEPDILSPEGWKMPLSVLSVGMTPGQGAAMVKSNPKILLSNYEQLVLSGASKANKGPQYFDLKYSANLTIEQALLVRPGTYSVSVLYLLLPK